MSTQIDQLLQEIGELPYMPEVALQVTNLLDDPDVSIKKLRDVIVTDPALTAKIMAVANSSFYGRLSKRKDLNQAMMTMGISSLRPLVLAFSVQGMFDRFGMLEKALWEHAVGVSIAAVVLVEKRKVVPTEDALLGGLLHDIGKTVLSNANAEKYRLVVKESSTKGCTFRDAEQTVYGFTHPEVGAHALHHWRFPQTYELMVRFHHDLSGVESHGEAAIRLTAVVNLANQICHVIGVSMEARPEGLVLGDLPAARRLGFSNDVLESLLDPIFAEIEEKRAIFV